VLDCHNARQRQLFQQRRGDRRSASRDHDAVVGCVLRPAQRTVAVVYVDTVVARPGDGGPSGRAVQSRTAVL
jgi:hypothetical protein